MPFYYDGELVSGPQGPAGPDGNPVGTVISFMGTSAPKDYLVCDGAEYDISEYPALAALFQEQFGTAGHFGGDGETTFAVPDMRNLFLRGYHGEAEESLSGEVGFRQEPTDIPAVTISRDNFFGYTQGDEYHGVIYPDTMTMKAPVHYTAGQTKGTFYEPRLYSYTARPVNMAVLYCIKAVESIPGGIEEYDTEDGWHVRKWSDGYVEMDTEVVQQAGTWQSLNNGFYYSSKLSAPEFPFPLTAKYEESVGPSDTLTPSGALTHFNTTLNGVGSLTKPRSYWLVSTQTDISEFGMRYHVTGRWK